MSSQTRAATPDLRRQGTTPSPTTTFERAELPRANSPAGRRWAENSRVAGRLSVMSRTLYWDMSCSGSSIIALRISVLAAFVLCGSGCGDDAEVNTGETTGASTSGSTSGPTSGSTTVASSTADGTETDAETSGGAICGDGVEPSETVVRTSSGAVEGTAVGEVIAFRGVAYAEPPIGERRLRSPEPRACQPGITPALELGSRCPQVEKDAQGNTTSSLGDEDCLTLNVWTPATGAGDRPVLVFIHGGGNSIGSSADELYDGARLAAAEDVVVVTLNYRLGALGWLAHPSLAAEGDSGSSGNYALRDQILALEWVAANIEGFGGDPSRVLLFGQSAGAVNVCALLGAPAAEGLFQRAIVQSGGCSQQSLDSLVTGMSEPFIANTGCAGSEDIPACLRELDVATVVNTAPDGYPDVAGLSRAWGPHVDGVVLPMTTREAMLAGIHNQVPLIVGDTAAETATSVPPLTEAQYTQLVQATFGGLAPMVLAAYPLADYGDEPQAAYVALTSDVKFVCGTRKSARAAVAAATEPVYRYHFTYTGYKTLPNVEPLAFHGLELVYIFGNWGAVLDGGVEYTPNAADLSLAQRMSATWARFADLGDPSGADLDWSTYVATDDNALLLDEPTSSAAGVRTVQCDFWDMLLP